MFPWLKRLVLRQEFGKIREDIYEVIRNELDNAGTRRTLTLAERFEGWAKRDGARKLTVAGAHQHIARRLGAGASLSDAIAPFVPVEERLILGAGEESGRLIEAFDAAVKTKRANDAMRQAVASALAQPVFGTLGLIFSSALLGNMLWPELMASIPAKYWDDWALPYVDFCIWVADHWPLLPLLLLINVGYYYTLPRWTGRLRRLFDKLPPWSAYRDRNAGMLLIVQASLLSTGRGIEEALESIKRSSTPYMRWHISIIQPRIKAFGDDALKAFDTGLFSRPILDRMQDESRTRDFAETLKSMGDRSVDSVVRIVRKGAQIINAVGILVVGLAFAYAIAVQVIGTQDATDRYMRDVSGRVGG